MDCPGAVSVSASRAVLKFSQSIVVDITESAALPSVVKDAYRKGGASIPIVIFTDPAMEKIYGNFNHPQMKTQKYETIFKDAKAEINKAIKEGSFNLGADAPKLEKIEGSKVEEWTSAKGKAIKAKLIGIEGNKVFLFQTEAGKMIRATAAQLSEESVAKAKEMTSK